MTPLLEACIAAHGGLAAWNSREALDLVVTATGPAFSLGGQGRAFAGRRARLATRGQSVTFENYDAPSRRGIWSGAAARIEGPGGATLAATDRPHGLRWSPVDAFAFGAAALWSYVSFPFVLAGDGFDVRELPGRRLEVVPHPDVVTHAGRHVLWLDEEGRIARHDYTPVSFGPLAPAANRVLAHGPIGPILTGVRRRAVPRGPFGRPLPWPALVEIELVDASR